jgi:hypothetical protein
VIEEQDDFVRVGGTRDGSWLQLIGLPGHGFFPCDSGTPPTRAYLLGVAHERCTARVRERLKSGAERLESDLPELDIAQPQS